MPAPRLLRQVAGCLCLALLPALARAEPPEGAYSLSIGGANGLALPVGETQPQCQFTPSGIVCVEKSDLATDTAGVVTGSATLTRPGNTELDLELALEGRVSGTTASPRVQLSFTATGTAMGPNNAPPPPPGEDPPEERDTLGVTGDGRMSCRLTFPGSIRFLCVARARLCLLRDGVQLDCLRFPFRALLRAARTPLAVELELATDASNRVTGDAQVRLGEREPIACDASGKYVPRKDESTLRLECSDAAAGAQLRLDKAVLADGGVTSGRLVFKVAGQKGKLVRAPRPPPSP